MSSGHKNLSDFDSNAILPSAADMSFGVVIAEWNSEITEALYRGAFDTLIKLGASPEKILKKHVPGSYELPLGAQFFLENGKVDAVICLGCVIQGNTRHFDFICDAVSEGIMNLNLKYNKPVIFGVLTTDTIQQAYDRSGGKHGNKGDEAAVTAAKMVDLKRSFKL